MFYALVKTSDNQVLTISEAPIPSAKFSPSFARVVDECPTETMEPVEFYTADFRYLFKAFNCGEK